MRRLDLFPLGFVGLLLPPALARACGAITDRDEERLRPAVVLALCTKSDGLPAGALPKKKSLRLRALIGLCVFSFLFSAFAQARELKDATGTVVQVPDHPHRIVTLAPSVGELAAEFLETDLDRIVGVAESTDYPPALKNTESVGPYQRFNLERVIALKPDLVLATVQGNSKDQVLHLRELGAPVFVMNTATFEDVGEALREASVLLGNGARGEAVAERFAKSLAEIRARGKARSAHPLRVLIQLDEQPLVVAGGPSFLSEALRITGAENVYGDAKTGYPRPSIEDVLRRNPDFVLVIAFGPDLKPFNRMAYHWGQYPALAAKKENQIKVIFADTLLRPSMRLLEGLAVLERTLYGRK